MGLLVAVVAGGAVAVAGRATTSEASAERTVRAVLKKRISAVLCCFCVCVSV